MDPLGRVETEDEPVDTRWAVMLRVVFLILLLGVLGPGGPEDVNAQRGGNELQDPEGERVMNLFETLDPSSPIDGVRLRLPEEWTVQKAFLLRYGTKPVPIQHRSQRRDTVLLSSSVPIQGPHELVVRVNVGDRPGTHRWHLTPFVTPAAPERDSLAQRRFLNADRLTQEVEIGPSSRPEGSNQALDLQRATTPLLLHLPASLSPSRSRPFTVEFWIQTDGLHQVILSSWTGEASTAYPLEFVVDRSGRLRFYSGQTGHHQALRTKTPVADGDWHHAAIVYDDTESRLHLMFDGARVDSARAQALPSVSESLPVAIGGRRSAPAGEEDSEHQRFTGKLDEIRVWAEARSAATIRQMRSRPFADRGPDQADKLFRLSFDESPDPERLEWAEGARRVPSRLTFRSPLRRLRAHTDGQSVTLRWEAKSADEGRFLVERSPDGTSFTTVDRLSPLQTAEPGEPQEITYTDEKVSGNIVFYRIRQVLSNSDTERTTGTIKIGLGADTTTSKAAELIGNFPNPFKSSSTIAYRVEESQSITLTVWNLSGKRIATLAEGMHEPGYYEHSLDARDLPSGTYFARLQTAQGVQSHRMVLLK